MPLFTDLVTASIVPLRALDNVREIQLEPDLRGAQRDKNGSLLTLSARCWKISRCGEVRGVYIVSPKIEVVNLFFFPAAAYALPVYALEFVILSGRPMVGVIDLPCLDAQEAMREQVSAWMAAAHRDFPLPAAADPPEWYRECRSGLDFFVRPHDIKELQQLHAVHLRLWQDLTQFIVPGEIPPARDEATHRRALQAYKHHHRDHSPGLPLLNNSFGAVWTRRFLSECLFV